MLHRMGMEPQKNERVGTAVFCFVFFHSEVFIERYIKAAMGIIIILYSIYIKDIFTVVILHCQRFNSI